MRKQSILDHMKGKAMHDNETINSGDRFFLSNDDPLGIKKITLGGDPPSLQVEARIATRQWANRSGSTDQRKVGE